MTYNLLNKLTVEVDITENSYDFKLDDLFNMAMRINKKRSFLFVSKVLGKHLAVPPQVPMLTGHLLAHRYIEVREQKKQRTTKQLVQALQRGEALQHTLHAVQSDVVVSRKALRIIGFAETATALGHAFFDAFIGDVRYVHTTREQLIDETSTITFEEEHSHASSHRLYTEPQFFDGDVEVVLVDDEMTTGKTNRNIIRQLVAAFPHIKTYTLVSILDWRDEGNIKAVADLANELGIAIHSVSILQGQFTLETHGELPTVETLSIPTSKEAVLSHSFEQSLQTDLVKKISVSGEHEQSHANYYAGTGRFGCTVEQKMAYAERLKPIAATLNSMRSGERGLVLGTGEFMYIPMLLAAQMGDQMFYHSTTRSPIYAHEDSVIYQKLVFHSPEFRGVTNYLYNVAQGGYDDVFVVFERIIDQTALAGLVHQLQPFAQRVHVVTLGGTDVATV